MSKTATERLLEALMGLPQSARRDTMIACAMRFGYHDYRSVDYDMPKIALVHGLRAVGQQAEALVQRVIAGEFDESKEEADEWAASPGGQAVLQEAGILSSRPKESS